MEKLNCSFVRLEELKIWDQKNHTALILIPALLATTNHDMLKSILYDFSDTARSKIVIGAKYSFSKCRTEIINMCWHLFDNYMNYDVVYECVVSDYGRLNIRYNYDNRIQSLRTVIDYDIKCTSDVNVNLIDMSCNKHEIYVICSFLEMIRCLGTKIAIIQQKKMEEAARSSVLDLFGER